MATRFARLRRLRALSRPCNSFANAQMVLTIDQYSLFKDHSDVIYEAIKSYNGTNQSKEEFKKWLQSDMPSTMEAIRYENLTYNDILRIGSKLVRTLCYDKNDETKLLMYRSWKEALRLCLRKSSRKQNSLDRVMCAKANNVLAIAKSLQSLYFALPEVGDLIENRSDPFKESDSVRSFITSQSNVKGYILAAIVDDIRKDLSPLVSLKKLLQEFEQHFEAPQLEEAVNNFTQRYANGRSVPLVDTQKLVLDTLGHISDDDGTFIRETFRTFEAGLLMASSVRQALGSDKGVCGLEKAVVQCLKILDGLPEATPKHYGIETALRNVAIFLEEGNLWAVVELALRTGTDFERWPRRQLEESKKKWKSQLL